MRFLKQFAAAGTVVWTLVFASPAPVLSGVESSTGITYSVAQDGPKYILSLRLPASRKIVTAWVTTAPQENVVLKITKEPGAPASEPGLTQEEINSVVRFGENWKPSFRGESTQMLMRLVGWLSAAPAGRSLDTPEIGINLS